MVLVVFSSLRCVRAQRRRAHSGLLGATWQACEHTACVTRLALALQITTTIDTTAAHALLPCAALCARLISSLLLQHPSFASARGHQSGAVPRLFEPSLRVTTDPVTPRTLEARGSHHPARCRARRRFTARDEGCLQSAKMAVPDKVALGLFFFWWHGSSVRALPSFKTCNAPHVAK